MLRALVIVPNVRTKQVNDLLAIAKAEIRKREHTGKNLPILALEYVPRLGVFVAIYEVQKPRVLRHEVTMANNG